MASSSSQPTLALNPVGRRLPPLQGVNREIARLFGLTREAAPPIVRGLVVPTLGITLIRGVSGAGKSTVLDMIEASRTDVTRLAEITDPGQTPAELLPGTLAERVRWLGRFGLGEAMVMITPAERLSVGQRHRLDLALLMATRPRCVVIDEFLSGLDELTASVVAWNFQKVCREEGVTAYLASAQDHVFEAIGPDHVVSLGFHGRARVERTVQPRPRIAALDRLEVGPGTAQEMRSLSPFHYQADVAIDWRDPRLNIRIARLDGIVVGGAVFSPPLPAFYDRVEALATINRRVLSLLRTIVHPVVRGAGLTRHLLPVPDDDVSLLSTMSAMGGVMPFHLSHGFELVSHPRSIRRPLHDRLEAQLSRLGVDDPSPLYDIATAQRFWDRLTPTEGEELGSIVRALVEEDNLATSLYLASHAGVPLQPHDTRAMRALFRAALDQVAPTAMGLLLSEALFFPMQGAVKRISKGA